MSASDTTQVDGDPQGLDDGAMGGPAAWGAVVANLQGQGPEAPPPPTVPRKLHDVVGDLERFDWLTRPAAHGGFFCWSETGTAYCAGIEDLRALVRKVSAEAYARARREKADAARDAHREKKGIDLAATRSEAKNAARDRRVEAKRAFMDALGRAVAAALLGRDDQHGGAS